MGCHPEGPGQAGEMDLCEPHEVQQGKVQGLHLVWGNPRYKYRLGDEGLQSSPAEKDFRVLAN